MIDKSKLRSEMYTIGTRVQRGPDWKYTEQDGGEGETGSIVCTWYTIDGPWASIEWDNECLLNYRIGAEGCFDIIPIVPSDVHPPPSSYEERPLMGAKPGNTVDETGAVPTY